MKAYWEQMCWLGPENWGALPLNVPTSATTTTTTTTTTTSSADTTADSVDMTGAEAEVEVEVVEVTDAHRESGVDDAGTFIFLSLIYCMHFDLFHAILCLCIYSLLIIPYSVLFYFHFYCYSGGGH